MNQLKQKKPRKQNPKSTLAGKHNFLIGRIIAAREATRGLCNELNMPFNIMNIYFDDLLEVNQEIYRREKNKLSHPLDTDG